MDGCFGCILYLVLHIWLSEYLGVSDEQQFRYTHSPLADSDWLSRVYQDYYLTHQLSDYSSSAIAWIGSVQVFLQYGGGLLGGPLFDRYGAKVSVSASPLILTLWTVADFSLDYHSAGNFVRFLDHDGLDLS